MSVNPIIALMSAKHRQRDYMIVWCASVMDRIHALEAGVPSKLLTILVEDMGVPQKTLCEWTGIAPATATKKLSTGQFLSPNESEKALGIAQLIGKVETLVKASGNEDAFNASEWTAQWLGQPNPALGGQSPRRYLKTATGQAIVSDLIAQGASGSFS